MSNGESNSFLSLAELAGMNTDDIAVITSRLPTEGIFRVRTTAITSKAGEPKDGKSPNFYITFKHVILAVKEGSLFDKSIDPETLVGKNINDPHTLWTTSNEDFFESLGLLKGRFTLVGLPCTGAMGGVEGQAPGWLDGGVNHEFDLKVQHSTKNGDTRAYVNWLKTEKAA